MSKPTKTCTKCKRIYPATADHFHRWRKAKDGLQYWCIVCAREYRANYYRTREATQPGYVARKTRQVQEWRDRQKAHPLRHARLLEVYREQYARKVRRRQVKLARILQSIRRNKGD